LEKERFQLDFRFDIEAATSFALGDLESTPTVITETLGLQTNFRGDGAYDRAGLKIRKEGQLCSADYQCNRDIKKRAGSPDRVGWS
jgi:hypothetical protein